MIKKINLACGNNYIVSAEWLNIDFESNTKHVKKINLLDKLPFPNNSFEVIYSSHFIEHIDCDKVHSFLLECNRILKPGGSIRIVTPDFEKLCKGYLSHLEKNEHEKKEFMMISILDQLVRKKSGGQLRDKIIKYKNSDEMLEFINFWNGKEEKIYNKISFLKKINKRLFNFYIKIISVLLPRSYRNSNLSYTNIGENHQWLWDFESLSKEISQANFSEIKKKNHNETNIKNLELKNLDYFEEEFPRKGYCSMYIEAKKI